MKSNQTILKEISPVYSLEGLMLKLKLQYFGHLMWRANSFEKTPMLGQEKNRVTQNEMVGWHYQINGHKFGQTLGDSERQGSLVCCSPWGGKESDTTERLNNNHHLESTVLGTGGDLKNQTRYLSLVIKNLFSLWGDTTCGQSVIVFIISFQAWGGKNTKCLEISEW